MEDFFDAKASRLPRKLLEDALKVAPAAGAALLGLPLGRAASARTPYRRTQALAVLAGILRVHKASPHCNLSAPGGCPLSPLLLQTRRRNASGCAVVCCRTRKTG